MKPAPEELMKESADLKVLFWTFIHAIRQQKPDQLPLAIAEAAKN